MTTVLRTATLSLICLLSLFFVSTVLAEDLDVATSTATSTPTSTLSIGENTAKEDLWYKSERISGNIDVGDFVVGPGRSEFTVKPGQTVIQEISVTNRISDGRTFKLEVEDITGSSDGSSAVSLTGDERGPYSIRDYISFPEETFVLALGERAKIPVIVSVPPDAEPGGYYGSVLVSTVQTSEDTRDAVPRSPIIARVGSLFFLTVEGDYKVEGKTLSIDTIPKKSWYQSGPIEMGVLYENTGSIHVNPYGEISIKNMFGEEVGYIEIEPWFVLPASLRVREITWDRGFLLGRYTVDAKINRGYEDVIDEVSLSFWVLPWKFVGGVFVALFIILFSLRVFFRTFEFKRKGS